MSFLLPKRVKDLPPLEPDSEDEKTPLKPSPTRTCSINTMVHKFSELPFQPKRVYELPPLESDSEEEQSSDNLNCAILNESFILSPTKDISVNTPLNNKENDINRLNEMDTGYGDSLAFNFNSLKINESKSTTHISTNNNPFSNNNLRRPFKFLDKAKAKMLYENSLEQESKKNSEIEEILCQKLEDDIPEISKSFVKTQEEYQLKKQPESNNNMRFIQRPDQNISREMENFHVKTEQKSIVNKIEKIETNKSNSPKKTTNQSILQSQNEVHSRKNLNQQFHNLDTPFKSTTTENSNFVTPQVKSFHVLPLSRRPLHLGTSSHKTKTAIENEFRSQKILFQTPYAASRPPISSINNSISLSLDDSVKTPTNEKISSSKDEIGNLKKTSENILNLEPILEKISINEQSEDDKKLNNVEKTPNEKVIVINKKEYIILKRLGSGGSSSVHLAIRKDSQQECALKIVDLRGDRTVVEGYLNETRLLAKLQGNVNVVCLYEYEHIPRASILYMVMEKGDADLHKILQSYKTDLPLYVLMNFWYQMLQSVNYIHENGVIHSDLKPANFLMVNGRLKLIDFGIASNIAIDSTSIIKFSQAGTFNYISPEALIDTSTGNSPCGKNQPKIKISTKSDVWSLGCILYLLLYKKTPFGHIKNIYAKVNAISNPETVIEYPDLPEYYPPLFITMAKKCLIHNPKKRLSVAELLKSPFDMALPLEDKNISV